MIRRASDAWGRKSGTYLLTVDKDVKTAPKSVVYPADRSFEVRAEVRGRAVEDVEAIALELVSLGGVRLDRGQPGRVEDLDEGGDLVAGEKGGVEDCGEGAEEQGAGALLGRCGEDEVHGRAHRLHDFWREVVEANHAECVRGVCCGWGCEGWAGVNLQKKTTYIN